jgi:metal-dependent hydrolase (beta-lactamase superfamily II)
LHCTGENAVEYLKNHLPKCKIYTPATGSTWEI